MALFKRNKEPEGVPGKAVIAEYNGGKQEEREGPPSLGTKRKVGVDAVIVGGNGQLVHVKGWLTSEVWWLMADGDEIDIRLDPDTAEVLGYDTAAMKERYAPRLPEMKEDLKYASSVFRKPVDILKEDIEAYKGLPGAVKDGVSGMRQAWKEGAGAEEMATPDGDPSLAPIEGVTFDTWVAVSAGIVRERVRKKDYDELASRHGVPTGRWPEIEAAWKSRMMGNPGLAQRFGTAYQQAVKGE